MKRLVSLCLGLAMVLVAGQAFAFGGIAGAAHFSGAGVGRVGLGTVSGVNVNGAVTVNGITVLPDGTMIVPAVMPRTAPSNLAPVPRSLDTSPLQMTPIKPCPYAKCG